MSAEVTFCSNYCIRLSDQQFAIIETLFTVDHRQQQQQPHCYFCFVMTQPLSYTPSGVRDICCSSKGSVNAGSRAQIHHGIASHHNLLTRNFLHDWDTALREDAGAIVHDEFIKSTERDLYDAVSYPILFGLCQLLIIFTNCRQQLLTASQVVSP